MPDETVLVETPRLGGLSRRQLQEALDRFDLGTLVSTEPVRRGLFGQNIFLDSSSGRYVLRGSPHYPWQFVKERFVADLLHERSDVPVAYPYRLEERSDLFGWSYLIMDRLPGRHADELAASEVEATMTVLGENLAELHRVSQAFPGEWNAGAGGFAPFAQGYVGWLLDDVRTRQRELVERGLLTPGESAWVDRVVSAGEPTLVPFPPCLVMNDYNEGNVLLDSVDGQWRVTGLVDLMDAFAGDGEFDLSRMVGRCLERHEQWGLPAAAVFLDAYRSRRAVRPGFEARYELFMLRDRLVIWGYGHRPGVGWFDPAETFGDWSEPYVHSHRVLA